MKATGSKLVIINTVGGNNIFIDTDTNRYVVEVEGKLIDFTESNEAYMYALKNGRVFSHFKVNTDETF